MASALTISVASIPAGPSPAKSPTKYLFRDSYLLTAGFMVSWFVFFLWLAYVTGWSFGA